ncbi:hypothetical protein CTAYLR_006026 [Chrysophaeum taylorii]|uniref:Rab-GAP TBC domain-containing protein n=1 Tax=Chrysophaeum taylorii TaxID=2483200 RepID=A0AAD7UM48_9STRA|nr:hypothetical protein CTAYLR_006026 [Chrysophaeum taylorii]
MSRRSRDNNNSTDCSSSSSSSSSSESEDDTQVVEEDGAAEGEWSKYDLLVAEHREMCLEELVWRGIPRTRRRREWVRLSGAAERAEEEGFGDSASGLRPPPLLAEASSAEGMERLEASVPAHVLADIEIDVPRCGVSSRRVRAGVRRVLLAFAARNEATRYCQGLNVVAATILSALSPRPTDEDVTLAFWLVVVLAEERCAGWWESTFQALMRDIHECCGRARELSRRPEPVAPVVRKRFFGGGGGGSSTEARPASPKRRRSESVARDIGTAIEKLVEELGAPVDLMMSQWLLTAFAHAGGEVASIDLRLRALDVALCAPNPHGTDVDAARGPGSTALLALSLSAVAAARIDGSTADVVQAARALESALGDNSARERLFAAAHALSRDARLFSPSENASPKSVGAARAPWYGLCGNAQRLSPSAFWLEAARRVTENAVQPLERAVAAAAPSLGPRLEAAAARAAAAVADADAPPLAFAACDARSRAAMLRLVRHILGDPLVGSRDDAEALAPPNGAAAVVHAWGSRDDEATRENWKSEVVAVSRSARAPLRRFSLALFVAPLVDEESARRGSRDEGGLDDDADADDAVTKLASTAGVRLVVVDLEAFSPPKDGDRPLLAKTPLCASTFSDDDSNSADVAYALVAGRVALRGQRALLKAVGAALYHLSAHELRTRSRPDFFVVGPLDAETRRDLRDPGVYRHLAEDERRLLGLFGALPRARALYAIETLLARARSAQTAACALDTVANAPRCGPTWRSISRWLSSARSNETAGDDRAARHSLADLDIPELRALSADRQLPIEDCRAALREFDRRTWFRVYSRVARRPFLLRRFSADLCVCRQDLADALDSAVIVELPAMLKSAAALCGDADRAASRPPPT